ncbi:hypothetical protein [Marinibactrum halimedae]|uniref:hypothetical protein n=1 Tax=Marinibactrum halimedae TaxID=1444977 RepID=UPI001E612972|nr:hypothetical protein [Marinibactrum halimedae]MCD9459056.1 hypothetical protein [Marinibactrum halimedae]
MKLLLLMALIAPINVSVADEESKRGEWSWEKAQRYFSHHSPMRYLPEKYRQTMHRKMDERERIYEGKHKRYLKHQHGGIKKVPELDNGTGFLAISLAASLLLLRMERSRKQGR